MKIETFFAYNIPAFGNTYEAYNMTTIEGVTFYAVTDGVIIYGPSYNFYKRFISNSRYD